MDKRKLNWVAGAVLALAVVFLALMLGGTLNRTAHITLPASNPLRDPSAGDDASSSGSLTVVEITPDTVQAAIASLSRPASYGRSVSVTYFWKGGSGTQELYTIVRGPWTRTDRGLGNGQTRISITNGQETYIWYGYESGAQVYAAPAGDISADDEQSIPTYEDILDLPAEDIVQADYRSLDVLRCIYVETAADAAGYSLRYWVSVDTGLLVQAEKLLGEETVYRMTSLYVDQTEYDASRFTLPDGTVLLDGGEDASMEPMESPAG
ncbi:MAG: hypothetical protein HFG02_05405 [Oscillibacter sp.]|nr:hypothetical protein [Oscillibacter sp.]